jgi:hypothetical protein
MANMKRYLLFLAVLFLGASIGLGIAETANKEKESNVTTKEFSADLAVARQGRILFSHHSVGANIIMGIQQLEAGIPGGSQIRMATPKEADSTKGPLLIQFSGGQNKEPKTKIDSFATTISDDTSLKPDLALMKFCFVDFNPRTNVEDLFSYYRSTIETLKREHPEIRFAHVTVPLTVRPTGMKWRLFRLIGKEVWEDSANVKRAEFNHLLKQTFGKDPIFDLASVEATTPDGSVTTFEQNGQKYLSMFPGYAESDGAHLNPTGQKDAGAAFIQFIAEALKSNSATR